MEETLRQPQTYAHAGEGIVKRSFNLELVSGISVLVTIGSLVMVTVFLLPTAVHRAPVTGVTGALASSFAPPPAAVR